VSFPYGLEFRYLAISLSSGRARVTAQGGVRQVLVRRCAMVQPLDQQLRSSKKLTHGDIVKKVEATFISSKLDMVMELLNTRCSLDVALCRTVR
jgi:hypothetical protein